MPSVIFYTVKIEKVFNELALAPPLDGTDGSFWEISTFTIGILQMTSEFFRNSSRIMKRDYSNYVARVMKRGQKEQDSYDVSLKVIIIFRLEFLRNFLRILLKFSKFLTGEIEKVSKELMLAPFTPCLGWH